MPGQVLLRVSVPANGRIDVMTGTPHEFPDARGNRITVAAVAEGANPGDGQCTVMAGTRTILENGNLTGPVAAGTNPIVPDNKIATGGALPGERIRCFLINTSGLAAWMTALVDLS